MTDIPLVLCFDKRILTGAGVTVLSLLDAAAQSTTYRIHILHPGLGDVVETGFEDLVRGTRHSVAFHEIAPSRFDGAPKSRKSWTEIVYYRLLTSEILNDTDRAIYSDVDVFFKHDLAEIFSTDIGSCEWGGVAAEANTPNAIIHPYYSENVKKNIVWSGFMLMNLAAMRKNGAVRRYFETIDLFHDRLTFFDLDLLNIATPEIHELPLKYVVQEDIYEAKNICMSADYAYLSTVYSNEEIEAARSDPAIIHFGGPRGKPWRRQFVPAYYTAVARRLPDALKRKTFRDHRKKWLSRTSWRKFPQRSDAL